jgi:hypothetical protein
MHGKVDHTLKDVKDDTGPYKTFCTLQEAVDATA